MPQPYVAVVGAGRATPEQAQAAEDVGRALAARGAVVVCGGLGGVMEAACRGAKDAGGTLDRDELVEDARRDPARRHVPGHKGGAGADPGLVDAIGERALAVDIPALTWGIDVGEEPTSFQEAQRLAAGAWGAKRSWFL